MAAALIRCAIAAFLVTSTVGGGGDAELAKWLNSKYADSNEGWKKVFEPECDAAGACSQEQWCSALKKAGRTVKDCKASFKETAAPDAKSVTKFDYEKLYESGTRSSADASTSSSADSSASSGSSGSSDTKQLRKACCEVLAGSYADQAEASKKLGLGKKRGFGALWGRCKDAVGPANKDAYKGALQPPVSDGVVDEAAIAECFDGSLIPTSTSSRRLATTTASLASGGSAPGVHYDPQWGYICDTTKPHGQTTTPPVPTTTEPSTSQIVIPTESPTTSAGPITTFTQSPSSTDTVKTSTSQIVIPTESPTSSAGPITTFSQSTSEIVTLPESLTTFSLSTASIVTSTEPTESTAAIVTSSEGNPCATTLPGGGNPCDTTGGAVTLPIAVEPNMTQPTPTEPIPVEPNSVTTTTTSGFPEEPDHPVLANLAHAIGNILGTNTETTTKPPATTTKPAPAALTPAPSLGAQSTTLYSVPTTTNGSSGSGSGSSSYWLAWFLPILGFLLICCCLATAAGLGFALFKKSRRGSKRSRAVKSDGYDSGDSEQERFMEEGRREHQEPWMGMPGPPYGYGPGPMPPMAGPPPTITPLPMQTSFVGPPVVATSFNVPPQAAPAMW